MSKQLRQEDGIALVMALAITVVLIIFVSSMIAYSTSNARSANVSGSRVNAQAIAESGINSAASIVNNAANVSSPTLLGCSADSVNANNSALPCADIAISVPGGTAYVHGLYAQGQGNTGSWTITADGSVRNPTGAAPLLKAVTATMSIVGGGQANNISVWNYLYSTAPQDSGCELDLSGDHTTIQVPLYVTGDLCLSGDHSQIIEDKASGGQAVDIRVVGQLAFGGKGPGPGGNHSTVGTHPTPLTSGWVGGGCTTPANSTPHACGTADNYFVSQTDTPLTATPPATDFPSWYQNASPGPSHVCDPVLTPSPNLTASGNVFDNDGTMNGTNPIFNLTPTGPGATDYNCVTSTGTLSWNHTTNLLTIRGTIFFDGDVYVADPPGPAGAMYQGKGTIYVNGQLSFNSNGPGKKGPGGQGGLRAACADPHGNLHQCDMNGPINGPNHWDPNTNMIVFAVSKSSGIAVDMSVDHSEFQGDLLCSPGSTASLAGDHTQIEGGIICGKFIFGDHTQIFPMPTLTNLPPGAPLPPNAPATIGTPVITSG